MRALIGAAIFLILGLSGCATTMDDYQGYIQKFSEYRYCALAVAPVAGGRTDDAIRTNRVGSHTQCTNNQDYSRQNAIEQCSNNIGKQCVLAYEYDRNYNSYQSNQTNNAKAYEEVIVETKRKKCDGYGFQRGTAAFAQCMQQIEQQESMDSAIQMQQNELNRQEQERNLIRTQCYLSGKLIC